jgi:drug/metabolite transporter (DMT)-like permease
MKPATISFGSAAAALAICILWGGNVVALKAGLATFPPFWSAFWRMAVGILVVGFWAAGRGIPLWPRPEERRFLIALGVLFTVQITGLNTGVNLTSPAYAVVLLNSHPVFANLVGHFFVPEDRLSFARILGLAIAFGGICIVFLGRPEEGLASRPIWGNLIVTASAFLLGSRTVYTQRLVQTIEPVRPVFWQMVFGLPFFLIAGVLWEKPLLQPLRAEAVGAILYQGAVIAGMCFIVWTTLLTRVSPGLLSMFAFTTPVFGVMLAAAYYGEAVTPRLLIGLLGVTCGILIATRQSRRIVTPAAAVARDVAR